MTKFKVGERVRVYGNWKPTVCEIKDIRASGMLSTDECGLVHPKQCRRLKPKAKPAKKEARRLVVSFNQSGKVAAVCRPFEKTAHLGEFYSDNDVFDFIELLPGHTLVNREMLAKAWSETFMTGMRAYIPALCNALGLPEVKNET
jgi:hypothetical protein